MSNKHSRNGMLPPFYRYAPITPTNDTAIEQTDAIIIAVGGAIALKRPDGTAVTVTLPAGMHNLAAIEVAFTGTTATGITACYFD